jgi:phosphopantothenoylcysteine decarboxylase/phosphopantothenate--cysteine ligase
MLDPVRFLSNLSTGQKGYALARVAKEKGYQVTLISGPTALKKPRGVCLVPIVSAKDLKRACDRYFPSCDALIMTAAVCDFTPATYRIQKIHRTHTRSVHLKRTPDIVAGLGKRKGKRIVIGFCLETENWLRRAKNKIKSKHLDGIVANHYGKGYSPFGNRPVHVALMDGKGRSVSLAKVSKAALSERILHWMNGF